MRKIYTKLTERVGIIIMLGLFIASYAYASEISVDNVIKYANEAREKQGVTELTESEKLMDVAEAKLSDMIKNKYFAHTSPTGLTPWHWFEKIKYDYHYAGENLAISFMTAEAQQKAWMESATHRKNILNPKYQEIGVAVGAGEINGKTSIITVQEFGTLAGAAETANNSKNFSSVGNKNLIKESEGLAPQVLSGKKTNPIAPPTFLDRTYEVVQGASYVLYLISIMLIPVAFLSVAIDKILFLINKRNVIAHAN